MQRHRVKRGAIGVGLGLSVFAGVARGDKKYWLGDQNIPPYAIEYGAPFTAGGYWFNLVPPGASDIAEFGLGQVVAPNPSNGNTTYAPHIVHFGDYTVINPSDNSSTFFAGGSRTINSFDVGSGDYTFDFAGGASTGPADDLNSIGALTANANALAADNNIGMIVNAVPMSASLTILHGTLTATNTTILGSGLNTSGSLYLSGADATFASSGDIWLGNGGGSGRLQVVGGAHAAANYIGNGPYAGPGGQRNSASVLVDGNGSVIDGFVGMYNGTATASNGGHLVSHGFTFIGIDGHDGDARGSVTVTNGATWTGNDRLTVGGVYHTDTQCQGTLNVANGAYVSANWLDIANRTSGPQSVVSISAASISVNGPVVIGDQGEVGGSPGKGLVHINNSGSLSCTSAVLGSDSSGQGDLFIGTGTFADSGALYVADKGTASVRIDRGGFLRSQSAEVARAAGSVASIKLVADADPEDLVTGGSAGRWTVDQSLFLGGGVGGAGGTAKLEIGKGAQVTVGDKLHIYSGATLSGGGTVVGNVVNEGGVVAPADDPETLTIDGDYSQTLGLLKLLVNGSSPGSFDQLNVTGSLMLGGSLEIDLAPGYLPAPGTVFHFLNAGSIAPGTQFDSISLPPDVQWDISALASGGIIIAVPEPSFVALLAVGGLLLQSRRRRRGPETIRNAGGTR